MGKDEVLDTLEDSREQFLNAIEGLSDEAMQEPGVVGDWSVKDILSHLVAWEAELIKLLWQVEQGETPTTVHFSDQSVDALNASWYELTHNRPLERVLADFEAVRKQTVKRVDALDDEELQDPQKYAWLQGHALDTWIANDSFGHETEHAGQIQAWRAQKDL